MSGTVQKKPVDEYRMRKPSGLAKMRDIMDLARFLGKKMGFKVSADGLEVQEFEDGVHLKGKPGSVAVPFPFQVVLGNDEDGLYATIGAGTVSGVMVVIDGVRLDVLPAPKLRLTGTGTEYIYFAVTAVFAVTAENYVLGLATSLTVQIQKASSVPADVKTGEFFRLLATVVAGVQTAQVVQNSLDIYFRDDGTGSSKADAIFNVSG